MGIENRTWVDFDREQVGCVVPGHQMLVTPTKVLSKKKVTHTREAEQVFDGFFFVSIEKNDALLK